MGNTLLDPSNKKNYPLLSFEAWLEQSTDLMSKKLRSENKFFRSVSFMYNSLSQSLMLKAFLKRDPSLSNLDQYRCGFDVFRKSLDPHFYTNMLPFMNVKNLDQNKEDFVVAMRQYLALTLQQRLQNQPVLSIQQKMWIILQMIICVYGLHVQANLYHGHIRSSNFLLQTNMHVVLTDFASYKPLYMLDDLAESRLFFGSSSTKCTVAPQKLITFAEKDKYNRNPNLLLKNHKKQKQAPKELDPDSYLRRISQSNGKSLHVPPADLQDRQSNLSGQQSYTNEVKPLKQMDIFSLGCTIAEVFLNGKALMTYQNLLQLKKGEFSLQNTINSASQAVSLSLGPETAQIIKLLLQGMLDRDPQRRPTIEQILAIWLKITENSDKMMVLWYLNSAFCKSPFFSPDLRIGLMRQIFEKIEELEVGTHNKQHHYQLKMNMPIPLQKIDLLRNFTNMLDRNIYPMLYRMKLLQKTIIDKIESQQSHHSVEQLETNSPDYSRKLNRNSTQSQNTNYNNLDTVDQIDSDSQQQSSFDIKLVQSNSMSVGVSSSSNSIMPLKSEQSRLTGSNNLYSKKYKFHKRAEPGSIADNNLCIVQWNQELQNLMKPRYKSTKLTDEEIHHNILQDTLEYIKKNQALRNTFPVKITYYGYQLFLSTLFATIRKAAYIGSKLVGIQLLYLIGSGSTDKVKISKVLPYLFVLVGDYNNQVCSYALRKVVDLLHTIKSPFATIEDAKYYKMIVDSFAAASKSVPLRPVFFQLLPAITAIIEWLAINCVAFTKSAVAKDHILLVDSIIKQYVVYSASEKEILMGALADIWLPNVVPIFGSMLNIDKLLGFKEGVKIASHGIRDNGRMEFLDMCLESGLEESGTAAFYAIRYFRLREISSQIIVAKILPFLLYPHRWIREETEAYINMCLDNYPPSKTYFLFKNILEPPFPLNQSHKNQQTLLPKPLKLNDIQIKDKKITLSSTLPSTKILEAFKKYLSRVKPPRQFPQQQQELRKWRGYCREVISGDIDDKLTPNVLGEQTVQYIVEIYRQNLLYYLNLIKKEYEYDEKMSKEPNSLSPELIELCDKMYEFSLKKVSTCYNQKILLSHIQFYLATNTESFMKTHGLKCSQAKKLFCQNLIRVNSLLSQFENIKIAPIPSLKEYFREPTETGKMSKPMGTLITEIHEHRDTISCIEKICDRYFVTGSYDGTLRIFDSKRIEEDINTDSMGLLDLKSLGDESSAVRVSSLAAFEETQSVVVGTSKGLVGIVRLETLTNPRKTMIKKDPNSSCIGLIQSYQVKGEVEKVVTFKNDLKHNCFSVVTAQGFLGLQDVRAKNISLKCNLGKERGLPKCLISMATTMSNVIGTINGYLMVYDIRCNLLSSVYQLQYQNSAPPIMHLQNVPLEQSQSEQLIALCYPSKNYEFCYFNINKNVGFDNIKPDQIYTSGSQDDCVSVPFLTNKTKLEAFKNYSSSLSERTYYKFVPDFFEKLDILQHFKDPLTPISHKVRQGWLSNCKQRYAQITSISNKRYLPFLDYLSSGILTNFNPPNSSKVKTFRQGTSLALLNAYATVNKKDMKISSPIEKEVRKINGMFNFLPQEESEEFVTSCKVLPGIVVTGGRDSIVRIYK